MGARWATFDCYGTLVDWNGGIQRELARLFGSERSGSLLRRYHELEPEVEADGSLSYRDVLTDTLVRLAAEEGLALPAGEEDALARSLPTWDVFPEVPAALEEARRRGWRLAILSNSDADLIAASKTRIGVPFDETVVAGEIGSYKPGHAHWEEFFRRTEAERELHVHVGASLFHDVAPANELGLRTVWINRGGVGSTEPPKSAGAGFAGAGADNRESGGPRPLRELPSLAGLADVLDELVPK